MTRHEKGHEFAAENPIQEARWRNDFIQKFDAQEDETKPRLTEG